jgi:hypothetical protein
MNPISTDKPLMQPNTTRKIAPHMNPNSKVYVHKLREQDIQRTIIAWLRLKRYFWWRNNTGAMVVAAGKNRRFIKFGTKGAPDIFVIRRVKTFTTDPLHREFSEAQIWGIECKAPNGSQSVDQHAFEEAFREAGGYYLLAKSLDDVIGAMD